MGVGYVRPPGAAAAGAEATQDERGDGDEEEAAT